MGTGCVVVDSEMDGAGETIDEGFRGKNAGAFGFSKTLEGEGVVPEGGGWGRGSSRMVSAGATADKTSEFSAREVRSTGGSGRNEGRVCVGGDPSEWWGCSMGSCSFSGRERIGLGTDCVK